MPGDQKGKARELAIQNKDLSQTFHHKPVDGKEPVTGELIDKFRETFLSNDALIRAKDTVTRFGLNSSALVTGYQMKRQFHFSHTVDNLPSITDQKRTGRCWMFASLNDVRCAFIKKHKLDSDFEFSQSYLFFYHKLEQANAWLDKCIQTRKIPEKTEEIKDLFSLICPDGGYWVYFANLYNKYGIVPQEVMPDHKSAENSTTMNKDLKQYVKKAGIEIRNSDLSDDELHKKKDEYLEHVTRILGVNLGFPPKTFNWQFVNKDKKVNNITNCTPKEFADEYVPYKPEEQLRIDCNPLEEYPEYKVYHNEMDLNVTDGWPIASIKLPREIVLKAVMDSIKDNRPVTFAQAVGVDSDRKSGILDVGIYDKAKLYQVDIGMSTTDAIRAHDINMTHMMLITGFHDPNNSGQPTKLQIHNSWGGDRGKKGVFLMTKEWFDKCAMSFIVDKKYLPKEVLERDYGDPIKLGKLDLLLQRDRGLKC